MGDIDEAFSRLRSSTIAGDGVVASAIRDAGVGFVAVGGPLEARWTQAVAELEECVHPIGDSAAVLNEGGVYLGSWIESTGTINAELLARFAPRVARDTHLLFAAAQRDDGMIPYKVTDAGPAFSQIQIVTPLARTVWNHYRLGGLHQPGDPPADIDFLRTMYDAMVRYDEWLVRYRDTRGTGGVEAFCTFDTGHDLSPRFWHVPERGYRNDARLVDPASATLPFVAPDLTANIACQRAYLALIADELGLDGDPWREKAAASVAALMDQCYDPDDGMFYDRDATGRLVRVASDVLLRVLACEIGDAAFFTASLERYLMSTRKFLAGYGFTSIAMDDPRFDHDYTRNSWGGPSNFLTLIRAPHAFEHHGHVAELGLSALPVLEAIAMADTFPQCLDPWTGDAGFTAKYSPSILWLLDALERHCGILARPDGEVWLSGLTPTRLGHGAAASAVASSRRIAGTDFELAGDDELIVVRRNGTDWLRFPRGWRVVVVDGEPTAVVGLAPTAVSGDLVVDGHALTLDVSPNERVGLRAGDAVSRGGPGFVAPRT